MRRCNMRKDSTQKHVSKFFVSLAILMLLSVTVSIGISSALNRRDLPENTRDAEYVGSEDCMMCHEDAAKEFSLSPHARIDVEDKEGSVVNGCETCHGPGSVHVSEGGGRGTMVNPSKYPQICFDCHSNNNVQFRMPYRHPVLEGKMSCSDCHNSHGSDNRPWTATSLDGVNGVCYKCHKDQKGPFVFEHEALKEGCTNCHDVHGSIHEKMLIARDSNLCLRCHTQADYPKIGNSSHAGRFPEGPCFSGGCHTAVHGSQFDDHMRY